MIEIEEAIRLVRGSLPKPRVEKVPLEEALGRFMADDFLAPDPSPRFDNSAMDGFAVRFEDVEGVCAEGPVVLKIIGESRAGVPFAGELATGQAVRISTGAMIPIGADTVVRVEDTEGDSDVVRIMAAKRRGQDVRYAGEEYRSGERIVAKGARLSSRHLAILAAAGAGEVAVFARPRVAVLVTGSELTSAGEELQPGQIHDSNRLMICAAVVEAGGEVAHQGRVGDDLAATVAAIAEAEDSRADFIICAGGVSVGPHDHVKDASGANGFAEVFWRVRQKPGKPLFFATKGNRVLFGLPGNPVSAYVCFSHYLKPAIGLMAGGEWQYRRRQLTLAAPLENRGKRPNLLRVSVDSAGGGAGAVYPLDHQGSHMLSSIVAANGYCHLAPGQSLAAGEMVEVFLF